MFDSVLGESIFRRALDQKILSVHFHQIRDFAQDKHRTVDDSPYGGGAGMVMRCEPLYGAWKAAKARSETPSRTIFLSPAGKPITQAKMKEFATGAERLILICGRYEGVDERFIELCVDEEMSIGDYVLTGGEIAAMVASDVLIRLLPGTVGNEDSLSTDSLEDGLLKAAQYTRPREFMGLTVPEVLLSGNHQAIADWHQKESLEKTLKKRPDLLDKRKK